MMQTYYRLLTIAGSDSGGGAGIQADLKTFSALGCYGMSVITALTAQNTVGVKGIYPIPPSFVEEQIEAVLSDIGADAVKIGMLYSADLIRSVAEQLKKFNIPIVVLDPVMVAQSGDQLLREDAIEALKHYIMPLAAIVTPNIPEAEVLTGMSLEEPDEIQDAARKISAYNPSNILIKGGHSGTSRCTDVLYLCREDRFVTLSEPRIRTRNTHGTGCTLSSAIASFLAKGEPVELAVRHARSYIQGAIQGAENYSLGNGCGPVHHFFRYW